MGGPRRTVAEARQALSEAVDIIRASWAGQPFRYAGQHYQVPDAQPGPRPAHDVGIWFGVAGPRAVRLAGAKADGWSVSSPYVPPPRLRELGAILTDSAREAGRDPDRIVRLYNVMGLITAESRDMFHGPKERWVDTLTTLYTDYQMNTFVFWPSGDRERQSRIFAEEIVPAVRATLASD
jgi:alkanesulfonate monooxygenase SsuD/methylene tetrahydromethanopterin reductase-like flavin-dependent oxidoreductase (luciferase family)